jgi:hypothetical protein
MSSERAASSVGANSEQGRVLPHFSHRTTDASAVLRDEISPAASIPIVPSTATPG